MDLEFLDEALQLLETPGFKIGPVFLVHLHEITEGHLVVAFFDNISTQVGLFLLNHMKLTSEQHLNSERKTLGPVGRYQSVRKPHLSLLDIGIRRSAFRSSRQLKVHRQKSNDHKDNKESKDNNPYSSRKEHIRLDSRMITRESLQKLIRGHTPSHKNMSPKRTSQKDKKIKPRKSSDQPRLRFEDLPEEIRKRFGDRCPEGFEKVQLIGKGGFSLVWKAIKGRRQYALKQVPKQEDMSVVIKQIWFGNLFFDGGMVKEQFERHPGVHSLTALMEYRIDRQDAWLAYQLGGRTLSQQLYKVFMKKKEQTLRITYLPLYQYFRNSPGLVKQLLVQLLFVLVLLTEHNIVHADIKAENILVDGTAEGITVKVIDYGSHCLFSNLRMLNMTTPEYTAPEILNFFQFQNNEKHSRANLDLIRQYSNPAAIDSWSLGMTMLELIHGIPLWIHQVELYSYASSKIVTLSGPLAVEDRNFSAIIGKQMEFVKRLDHIFSKQNHSGIKVGLQCETVIRGLMDVDPQKRMKPLHALKLLNIQHLSQRQMFLY